MKNNATCYLACCRPQQALCKHDQKEEEAYTKKTISTHNCRVAKELAVFEGAQSFSLSLI